ncbi:MAG: N-acetyl-gamma-glutamyl-phosphate reductase, partial [Bacteroidetes bacterium]
MQYRVGIIGGGGYTAGELLRILIHHPAVELAFVHSQSQAGKPVYATHEDLVGDTELHFTDDLDLSVDVIFLCSGHGKSASWLGKHQPSTQTLVIDLSSDFRLSEDFVYGLPELNREGIRSGRRIANPGCFATAIQLGLLPLAQAGLLTESVHIHAITGSTGAGQAPTATTHFSWRNNNLSIYKPFSHQHLAEIGRSLAQLQGDSPVGELLFLPLRGDFTRGIFASMYLETTLTQAQLQSLYRDYYASHPFTHMVAMNPNLKQVVNTNKGLVHLTKHASRALIVSVIDNLL